MGSSAKKKKKNNNEKTFKVQLLFCVMADHSDM